MLKVNSTDGFAHVMDHIMIPLEESEKVLPQLIWKFLNMNLLMQIQLRLDNFYE